MRIKILLLLSRAIMLVHSNENSNLEILTTAQPGIMFERRPDLKFIREPWTMSISIELDTLANKIKELRGELSKARENAATYRRDYYKNLIDFVNMLDSLDVVEEKLKANLKYYSNIPPSLTQFELLNNYVRKEAFNETTEGIINLEIEKAFALNSSVNKIAPSRMEESKLLNKFLIKLNYYSKEPNRSLTENNYKSLLKNVTKLIKSEMREIEEKSFQITEIIQSIQNGQIKSYLLDQEDWYKLIKNVEDNLDYSFPVYSTWGSVQNLEKIGQIRYGMYRNKFFIDLEVPLVGKEVSNLYKVRSVPVPQRIFNNLTVFAFIQPRSEYFLTRGRTHYHMSETELSYCKLIENHYLCPTEWFLFSKTHNCEQSLFFSPSRTNFEKCNIQVTTNFENQFIRSDIGDSWFFSIEEPMQIKQNCKDQPTVVYQLKGTGVLKFTKDCQIIHHQGSLTVDVYERSRGTRFRVPNIGLSIEKLAPLLKTGEIREIFETLVKKGDTQNFWHLQILSEKYSMLNQEDHNLIIFIVIVTSAVALTLFITGGIFAFLCYFREVLRDTPELVELRICEIEQVQTGDMVRQGILTFQ